MLEPEIDKKIKLPAYMRRMDELAWLLENASMCTAVSVINGRFYISANEFFDRTEARERNQQLDIVCGIMEYFKKVAVEQPFNSEIRKQTRDELMRSIFKNQIKTASFGRITIPEKIINAIVCTNVLAEQELPTISDEDLNKYIHKRKGLAYQTLGYGIEIYKRFLKIERAIQKAKAVDFTKINQGQLTAFKNFNYSDLERSQSNILFLEKDDNKSVHAEAQILNQIVDIIERKDVLPHEIYIGISKRCCKNCHCLLDAANEILQQWYGCLIKFEGAHDAEFEANWGRPQILKQVDLDSRSKTRSKTKEQATKDLSLQEKINKKYLEKLKEFEPELSYQESYDQRHTPSSSEATSEIHIESYRERLQNYLTTLEDIGLESSTHAKKLLKIGIGLCNIKGFTDLFDEIIVAALLDQEVVIDSILFDYNKKDNEQDESHRIDKITREELLEFLHYPKLCPKIIYDYFQSKGKQRLDESQGALGDHTTQPKAKIPKLLY